MAFFDELGKKFTGAIKTVEKKTSTAAQANRVHTKLSEATQELSHIYEQIGKAYYATRNAQDASDGLKLLCDRAAALEAEIAGHREAIDRIKGIRRCPNCGGVQPSASAFCASCGTKLPEQAAPESVAEPEPIPDEKDETNEATDMEAQRPIENPDTAVEINWPQAQSTSDESEAISDK